MSTAFQRDLSLPEEELRFEVGDPEDGLRLDRFLERRLSWCTRRRARGWIESGRCAVEPGRDPQRAAIGRVRASTRLRWGQTVVVVLETPAARAVHDPELPAIPILRDDEWLLAAAKPAGVALHPTRSHLEGSLLERLHRQLARDGRAERPSPCHRLDLETSGVVLFAKDPATRAAIGAAFEAGSIAKTYLAVVRGAVGADSGRIDLAIGPDRTSRIPVRRAPDPDGQPAVTRWRVLRRRADRTLLELRPETGRQHQLRVHLAAIGHPILGDRLYLGGDRLFLEARGRSLRPAEAQRLGHPRCALHAWRLELEHPATGEPVEIEAPPPADFPALAATCPGDDAP